MEQYVVIIDRSAGNDSVGEMWQETKVFGPDASVKEVMDWALTQGLGVKSAAPDRSSRRVTITKAHPAT